LRTAFAGNLAPPWVKLCQQAVRDSAAVLAELGHTAETASPGFTWRLSRLQSLGKLSSSSWNSKEVLAN